jgi:DNA-binding CsgD family transcriptional regulator
VCLTVALYYFGRLFSAPAGSLTVILLAPMAALLIYSAWFTGRQAHENKRKNLYVMSGIFWVQGLFIALLSLGSLAGMADQYMVVTSKVIYWGSLIYFVATLLMNITWSLLIAEDLYKSPVMNSGINQLPINKQKTTRKVTVEDLNGVVQTVKSKGVKSNLATVNHINPDLLTDAEKNSLLDSLTDKERDVFYLVTEGKRNGEMATILNSSEASIKVHRSRMTTKLGMKNPEDLKKLIVNSVVINEKPMEVKDKLESNQGFDLFNQS